MKKIVVSTIASAALAAPAMASSITISFANDNGNTVAMTFDQTTNTATIEGVDGSFPYTYDEETATICGDATGEGEVCATFTDPSEPVVGGTSPYTTTNGDSGTATITAVSE